jgi:hypothetical protein
MARSPLLLLLAAVACGDVRTLRPTGADAAPEGDAAPPAPGLVTVQIDEQFDEATYGDAVAGLPVLFFGPDQELIAEEETDDDGGASATVPPGSTVLILAEIADSEQHVLLAVFDVQPGDELVFPSPEPDDDSAYAVLGNMTIDMPDSADADLSYYRADSGCASGTSGPDASEVVLPFSSLCVDDDGEFDVVVRAFDTSDQVIESGSGHFTFADTGAATVTTWNGTQDLEVPVTGIPTELATVEVEVTPAVGPLRYGTVSTGPLELEGDDDDVSVGAIDGFGDALDVAIDLRPTQLVLAAQQAFYRLPPGTDELPLVLATELLPWYGRPVLDDSARTLSWTRTGDAGAPDAQYAYTFGETKEGSVTGFLAVVPPGWTSVTLPELPAGYDDFQIGDYAEVITIVQAIEMSGYEGYEIRETGILPFIWAVDDDNRPLDLDPGFHIRASGAGIN